MPFNYSKKIRTKIEIINALEQTVRIASKTGFVGKDLLFLKLATEEACLNAYEYCEIRQFPFFQLSWKIEKDQFLEISIKHQGEKFVIEKKDEIIMGPRGRGLQIILSIMDLVHLDEQDGEICMYMLKKIKDEESLC